MSNFFAHRLSVPALLLSALLSACGGDSEEPPAAAAPASPARSITITADKANLTSAKGPVQGVVDSNVLRFRGIPYASPPTGQARWRPPTAAAAWTTTLDASNYGKYCPQEGTPMSAQPNASEDCLNLDVYVPKAYATEAVATPRAVMVWIYGGANAVGATAYYDPTPLVETGNVIVVAVNYRVGALGFLAHPALDAEGHDAVNYGVMDQQLALKWVQENIAAFGGDKGNVTIFGESAGGLNTFTHLVSPLSAGLFHKAIPQSGGYSLNSATLAASQARGTAYATRIGCTDQTAACLRGKSVAEILAGQGTVNTASSAYNQVTVDGKVLVETQLAALTAGRFNKVPVMQGSTSNEGRTFTPATMDLATYQATMAGYGAIAGKTAAEALAVYSIAAYGTPAEAAAAAVGDFAFACSSRRANRLMSAFVPTYAYEFADQNASSAGAGHGSEVGYLMKISSAAGVGSTAGRGWDAAGASLTLSQTMRTYWSQFAKSGNPNATGVPNWLPFTAASDNVQYLVAPTPTQDTGFAARHQCAFWG